MQRQDEEDLIEEFLKRKGTTQCPPAFAQPSQAVISVEARDALRKHVSEVKERSNSSAEVQRRVGKKVAETLRGQRTQFLSSVRAVFVEIIASTAGQNTAIAAELNRRKVLSEKGKAWSDGTVRNARNDMGI